MPYHRYKESVSMTTPQSTWRIVKLKKLLCTSDAKNCGGGKGKDLADDMSDRSDCGYHASYDVLLIKHGQVMVPTVM